MERIEGSNYYYSSSYFLLSREPSALIFSSRKQCTTMPKFRGSWRTWWGDRLLIVGDFIQLCWTFLFLLFWSAYDFCLPHNRSGIQLRCRKTFFNFHEGTLDWSKIKKIAFACVKSYWGELEKLGTIKALDAGVAMKLENGVYKLWTMGSNFDARSIF